MATEIRDDHCTNDSGHPLTKLSAMPVHYKGLKPFQHKTYLAINLNQIASLSPDQEEVENSPDGKVFAREDPKDKFIGIKCILLIKAWNVINVTIMIQLIKKHMAI